MSETLQEKVKQILRDCEVEEKDIDNENLIENEILESIQVAEIVMNIEAEFGIEIDGDDIVPENFINIKKIEELILKYSNAGGIKGSSPMEIMWDMIARNAHNVIEQAGWRSSFTRALFSVKEMSEFVENVWIKIFPYINQSCSVMEIGIGSGLLARRIAPSVREYVRIDISGEMLKKTSIMLQNEQINNVKLLQGNAITLDRLELENANIVIINSVIQYLQDIAEYAEVIKQAVQFVKKGVIFVGDILDFDKQQTFLEELQMFGGKANIKERWYTRQEIEAVARKVSNIKQVIITDKKGYTIENELTKYRFDAIYIIEG